ncbi:MAG TPA: hypothetical protein VGH74_11825 [Planctomycetaceae bacterium]
MPQLGADDRDEPDARFKDDCRIEQEFARKIEQYNMLLKQERFDESIVLGNEALLLQPENPIAELMVLKAKYAKQDAVNRLCTRFKATVAADLLDDRDGSDAIQEDRRFADGAIHRLLYEKDEDVADGRCLLDTALERRVEAVDQICRLTDTQKRKLRLAGRGDIKQFLDRVEALRPKADQAQDDLQLCGNACFFGAAATRPARRPGLFENGSFFAKTLRTSLTDGQAAAFDASTLRRQEPSE